MKLILLALLALNISPPSLADEYQRGYSASRTCTRNEYREEYVPGTQASPGYVKSWTETIEVPCNSKNSHRSTNHRHAHPADLDTNDCSEGTIIGGLLGAGLAGMSSRGKDQWFAVPAGGVAGAMIGCQVDGG
ncbi:glycine zipper 2TM domain-containing protein [Prochlorococcus sp. MIT 1341]|uniref:glycine zipper 2TM domain-containing protein n=1 Tax=Prochlorococcus sp. MIT 1341 TaxID=3096221 RepID=UPI002A74851E|nr:glycine zipper 2TM domain-containing protein [Prochlorococcus sp. MIT 1341]